MTRTIRSILAAGLSVGLALVRNDRFEIGPTAGFGYLWLSAGIRATGTIRGPGSSFCTGRLAARGAVAGGCPEAAREGVLS